MKKIPSLLRGSTSFAVIDVETTGFSPLNGDRIVEVAIVVVNDEGIHEWSTLVNPLRDPGPAHIHGLSAADVAEAPAFSEIVGDVLEMIHGSVLVAHNVRFDRDFLSAELSAAGVFLPSIPSICTLELAYVLEPGLANHRLATCCGMAGIDYYASHTALGDARAEAALLRRYLERAEQFGVTTLEGLGCAPSTFPLDWPEVPRTGRQTSRGGDGTGFELPYLARVIASLGTTEIDKRTAPYMDLLDHVLEDERVTGEEAEALQKTAEAWGLSASDVLSAHNAYLESVVNAAVADGKVTNTERKQLETVAQLLAIDPSIMHAMLARGLEDPG